jgi:8-oxo-dGTP diphosphatase
MTERFRLASAVHLLLLANDRVLLLRRCNTGYQDGNYGLIAGHLDGDEPVRQALAREALEEAAITVRPEDLRFVHVMHSTRRLEVPGSAGGEYVHFFFTATSWGGDPSNAEPHMCDELRWCGLDDLPENLVPYLRAAINHIRVGNAFSEFGWD